MDLTTPKRNTVPVNLIIKRRDYTFPKKPKKVYHLSFLKYFKKDGIRNIFLRVIKKSLLGANFLVRYNNRHDLISMTIYWIIMNILYCFYYSSSNLYQSTRHKLFSFAGLDYSEEYLNYESRIIEFTSADIYLKFLKIIVVNIPTMLIGSFYIGMMYLKRKETEQQMLKLINHSIQTERNILKEIMEIKINDNFHIDISTDLMNFNKILKNQKSLLKLKFTKAKYLDLLFNIPKNKNNSETKGGKRRNKIFEYVINIPKNYTTRKFPFMSFLTEQEKNIIEGIIRYNKGLEIDKKLRFTKFLCLNVLLLMNLIANMHKYSWIHNFCFYLCIIILTYFYVKNAEKEKNKKVGTYIKELNEEIMPQNYFLFSNENLICLMYLKEESNSLNQEYINKEIEEIIS